VSTGIEATGDVLRLNPQLPPEIQSLQTRVRYRGHSLDLQITRDRLTIHGRERGIASIKLGIRGEVYEFACGSTREFLLT
jgi:trehalose/maltose hydrolase-like predicted phosphorylase